MYLIYAIQTHSAKCRFNLSTLHLALVQVGLSRPNRHNMDPTLTSDIRASQFISLSILSRDIRRLIIELLKNVSFFYNESFITNCLDSCSFTYALNISLHHVTSISWYFIRLFIKKIFDRLCIFHFIYIYKFFFINNFQCTFHSNFLARKIFCFS